MPLPAQKLREIVFQLLYSQEFATVDATTAIPFYMAELKVTRRSMREACEKMEKIFAQLSTIDPLIEEASIQYEFDRISNIEKTILRQAIFEMLHDPSIPPKVAIVEGIRLCRKFGTYESANFVNAVLDAILQKHGTADREKAHSC